MSGRKLQVRGGGVVRVRPDGSGIELFSYGTRIILAVPTSPLLDLFGRDNTNDGGGSECALPSLQRIGRPWPPTPLLFKLSEPEIIAPLAVTTAEGLAVR